MIETNLIKSIKLDPFDEDVWDLVKFGMGSTRLIESKGRHAMYFGVIPHEINKNLAKKYIKYLINTTDKAFSTIYTKLRNIKVFLGFLNDKSLFEINRIDVEKFIKHLNEKHIIKQTFNAYIYANLEFIDYLIVSGDLSKNYFNLSDIKPLERGHSYKTVDENVIKQIFSVLNQLPLKEAGMFLLIYSTGMRVSEVCAIKVDSLFKNDNGNFIRFYSQKMRKEVINPIPNSLYELLIAQKKSVTEKHGDTMTYLFPSHNLSCYNPINFRITMQDFFEEFEIKNTDGTVYRFKSHDYRHTLATTMLLRDIPSYVIQKVLHHESIEMTSSYIDIKDQQKIERHKEFINIKG